MHPDQGYPALVSDLLPHWTSLHWNYRAVFLNCSAIKDPQCKTLAPSSANLHKPASNYQLLEDLLLFACFVLYFFPLSNKDAQNNLQQQCCGLARYQNTKQTLATQDLRVFLFNKNSYSIRNQQCQHVYRIS